MDIISFITSFNDLIMFLRSFSTHMKTFFLAQILLPTKQAEDSVGLCFWSLISAWLLPLRWLNPNLFKEIYLLRGSFSHGFQKCVYSLLEKRKTWYSKTSRYIDYLSFHASSCGFQFLPNLGKSIYYLADQIQCLSVEIKGK